MKSGIYRHYKGGLYNVVGLAHDANDEGRMAVVYFPLEITLGQLGPRLAVRTLQDFEFGHMHLDRRQGQTVWTECERSCERRGHLPRFVYQGPELTDDILNRRADYLEAIRANR